MKIFIIVSLSLSIVLISCRPKEILHLDGVSSKEVVGRHFTTQPELLGPRQIFTSEGAVVLYDRSNESGFLSFFDKQTGLLRRSWGIEGRGPGEYIAPRIIASQNELTLTSINGDFLKIGYIDSIGITPLNFKYKNPLIGSNFLFVVNDTKVVSVKEGEKQLLILNPQTGQEHYENYYPLKMPEAIPSVVLNNTVFQAHYSYHKSGRIFIAYQYQPVVTVVDIIHDRIIGGTQFDGTRNNPQKDDEGNWGISDPIINYTFSAVSDNFFYALYQNADRQVLRNNRQQSEIHKYDLSGLLIERIMVNVPLYHFAVERDDSRIYALSFNEDYISVVYAFDVTD